MFLPAVLHILNINKKIIVINKLVVMVGIDNINNFIIIIKMAAI